jgi:hypothetical protein
VNQKNANRSGATLRATREYQPTNRREDNITRRRRFTSCPLSMPAQFDEQLETDIVSPLDNLSAISTSECTHAGPRATACNHAIDRRWVT